MRGTEFAEMSAFAAVAERRSFAKAARDLGVSPSSLTQSVKDLEDRLGVRLLNRTTRRVSTTAVGEQFLVQLRRLLADFDAAVESVNAFRDKPMGQLRVTVPPVVGTTIIAPALARFMSEFPEIKLDISADSGFVDLVEGRFDAGIRRGDQVGQDMVAVRISPPGRFVTIASPDYAARRGAPQTPRDLAQHNCLRFRLSSGVILPWRYEHEGEELEAAIDGTLTSNDANLIVRAAADGVGIANFPDEMVAPLLAQGRLVVLLEDWAARLPGWFIYYTSRRQMPAPLRAFIDFLKRELKAPLAS